MQKQQKEKKIINKLKSSDKIKKVFWRKKKRAHPNFLQKNIKNSGRPFFNILPNSLSSQNYLRIDVSLFSNNVFCSLKDVKLNKLLCRSSAGKYKIKVSKKSLKYASKLIITNFFKELKKRKIYFLTPLILVLVAPSNLKKKTLLTILRLLKYIKNKRIMVFIKPKKVFNGCRVKKQIRKKQKRYAIYK